MSMIGGRNEWSANRRAAGLVPSIASAQSTTALDAPNMLYAGFQLTSGKVTGIVVGTGENTLLSRLVAAGAF